jgi:hypothetical protein
MPFDKIFGKLNRGVIQPEESQISVGFDLDDSTQKDWMNEKNWSNTFSSRVFYPTASGIEWYSSLGDRAPAHVKFMMSKSPMTKLNYLDKYHNDGRADSDIVQALSLGYISFNPQDSSAERDIALTEGFTLEDHLDNTPKHKT